MARTNDRAAIASHVQGLREAKAAFQALPSATRDALNVATELTLREIVRTARARLQASPSVRTRNLYNSLAWTLNKKSGRGRAGVTTGTTIIRTDQTRDRRTRTVRVRGIVVPGRGGGQAGARLDRPSRRAHFVEFGTRHMPAEPFMVPAAEGQKDHFLGRCKDAGKQVEQTLAQIGGGRHL